MNDKQLIKARNEIVTTYKIARQIIARGDNAVSAPSSFNIVDPNAFAYKYQTDEPVPEQHLAMGRRAMADKGLTFVDAQTVLLPNDLTVSQNANLTVALMNESFNNRLADYVSDTKRQSRNPRVVHRIATDLMHDVLNKYFIDDESVRNLLSLYLNGLPVSRYRKFVVRALREQNARQKGSRQVQVVISNIFDSHADVLVNPTNPEGVMGGGLALQFSQRFPQMTHAYVQRAKAGKLQLGRVDWHEVHEDTTTKYVANLHTMHLGKRATMDAVKDGLHDFVRAVNRLDDVKTVALPILGDGIGGLDTNEVLAVMRRELALVKADVTIYQFNAPTVDAQ